MENPATWSKAERIISDTMRDRALANYKSVQAGHGPIIGWSLAKCIAEALRNAGLLVEDKEDNDAQQH